MGLGWVVGENEYHEYVKARKVNSNNVAEYMALIRLLETVAAFPKPGDLRISGDSFSRFWANGAWVRSTSSRSTPRRPG